MEFKETIKQLHKKYLEVLKLHYKTNRLILNMILEKGIYKDYSDVDLWFRACRLNRFSDKYISKLYETDIEKGIDLLRRRGMWCLYVTGDISEIIKNIKSKPQYSTDLVKKFEEINEKLYMLAEDSIKLSNKWAVQCDLNLFRDGKFDINDYKK